ncbi:MAG: hypothetical protein B7Y33_02045, partial [Hydrogenophilales bacterium 16-62-9]
MTIEKKSPGPQLDAVKPARAPSPARRKKAHPPAEAPLAVTQPVQTGEDRVAATGGLAASRANPSPRHSQVELLQRVRQLEFELRTSGDALQRTIRELQSFNEELETSSEELHSTNAELTTVNAQLWEKIDALDRANSDVANLLASVDNATLFLDENGAIQRFTPSATRLFNLIAADVGRPLAHISTRFEDPDLLRDINQVLQNLTPSEREVSYAQDQWYLRRITPYRTVAGRICGVVLSLTDITQLKRAELKLRDLTEHLEQRVAGRTAELEAEISQRKLAERALRASEQSLRALIDDAPVVRYLQKIMLDAINQGASDIHLEPYEKYYRIRYRRDGILAEVAQPPMAIKDKIASRIKVLSRLDISEKRVPQDGRMKMVLSKNRAIDFRVSTLPTLYGEKIVMRILDPTSAQLGIEALGYEPFQKALLMNAVQRP